MICLPVPLIICKFIITSRKVTLDYISTRAESFSSRFPISSYPILLVYRIPGNPSTGLPPTPLLSYIPPPPPPLHLYS